MDIKDEIITYDSFRRDIEENNSLFLLKKGCFGLESKIGQRFRYLYDFLNFYWGKETKWEYTDIPIIPINNEYDEGLNTFCNLEMFFNAFIPAYYDLHNFKKLLSKKFPVPETITFFVKVIETNNNSIVVSGMPPIDDIDTNRSLIDINILTKSRNYDFIEKENIVLDYIGSYEIGVLYLDGKISEFKKNEYIQVDIILYINDLVKIEHKILDSEDD